MASTQAQGALPHATRRDSRAPHGAHGPGCRRLHHHRHLAERLAGEVKPCVEPCRKERRWELSQAKTVVTCGDHGFDVLGRRGRTSNGPATSARAVPQDRARVSSRGSEASSRPTEQAKVASLSGLVPSGAPGMGRPQRTDATRGRGRLAPSRPPSSGSCGRGQGAGIPRRPRPRSRIRPSARRATRRGVFSGKRQRQEGRAPDQSGSSQHGRCRSKRPEKE